LNDKYYWQLQAYMALTGASTSQLVYCLVNTPDSIIYDECRKLAWKMGLIDGDTSPEYIEACNEIRRNHTFEDIPKEQRIKIINIDRNDSDIQRMYQRIVDARKFIQQERGGGLLYSGLRL
jgi:hypothetical protein